MVSRRTEACQYGSRDELAIIEPRQSEPMEMSSPPGLLNPLWQARQAPEVSNNVTGCAFDDFWDAGRARRCWVRDGNDQQRDQQAMQKQGRTLARLVTTDCWARVTAVANSATSQAIQNRESVFIGASADSSPAVQQGAVEPISEQVHRHRCVTAAPLRAGESARRPLNEDVLPAA